ncbi:MAG: hypothetical protein HQ522_05560 [Bacteroidetes bacterium]|nr:hypothetical protein [Bacteroidota bacterium]
MTKFGVDICSVCGTFSPDDPGKFELYVAEKIDWRDIDSFRKLGQLPGVKQKRGMKRKAKTGALVTRAPMGYDVKEGKLVHNEDSVKVRSLFKDFLNRDFSLNVLSKNYGLSVNGLKKVLQNRTYLGEIKFDSEIHKAEHKAILSPEIFYAVQRKLVGYLRPRKKEHANKYVLKKTVEPLKEKVDTDSFEKPDEKVDESDDEKKGSREKEEGLYKSIFD